MNRYFDLRDRKWWKENFGEEYRYAIYREIDDLVIYYNENGEEISTEVLDGNCPPDTYYFSEIFYDPTSKYLYSIDDILDL